MFQLYNPLDATNIIFLINNTSLGVSHSNCALGSKDEVIHQDAQAFRAH